MSVCPKGNYGRLTNQFICIHGRFLLCIAEHAYDNTAFGGASPAHHGHHEMQERRVDSEADLARMGYSVYNGRKENR